MPGARRASEAARAAHATAVASGSGLDVGRLGTAHGDAELLMRHPRFEAAVEEVSAGLPGLREKLHETTGVV